MIRPDVPWRWLLCLLACLPLACCINVRITDCLGDIGVVESFKPTEVNAVFEDVPGTSLHTLQFYVTGNVSRGSIIDLNVTTNHYTTLKTQSQVLQFSVFEKFDRFCDFVDGACPLQPGIASFHYAFNVSNAYQGVSLETTFYIIDAADNGEVVGCFSVEVTPVMAAYVWYLLVFVIFAIMLLLGVKYVMAASLNPWQGTRNILFWSSNYVLDVNSLRLVTPGMSDFLLYLQWAFFMASLNLRYPGFFQPVLATVAWSSLLFHFNFVSSLDIDLRDNLYFPFGPYGLSRMARTVQLGLDSDVWPSFVVWFIAVTGIIFVVIAIYMAATRNWHKMLSGERLSWTTVGQFAIGTLVRLTLEYFALPLVTLSFFQMLIVDEAHSPVASDVFALLFIVAWLTTSVWIVYKVHLELHRSQLFDNLPMLLKYGPLFNTYKENRIMFFAVKLLVTFARGLAIGVLQKSGLAQITILAVVEIGFLVSYVYYRPFDRKTSMTSLSTMMSMIRLVIIFLMIPFVDSLGTNATVRGWIAYVILIIHCIVLLMFIVHISQVVFEVLVRVGGAGSDEPESRPMVDSRGPREDDASPGSYSRKLSTGKTVRPSYEGEKGDGVPMADVPLTSEYRRPSEAKPRSARRRESSFGEDSIMTPVTSKPDTFYRRPRRRQSSLDHANVQEDAETTEPDEERRHGRRDYAVREADMYITKKGRTSGEEAVEEEMSPQDGGSGWPLMPHESEPENEGSNNAEPASTSGLYGSVRGLLGRFTKRSAPAPASSFEVVGRQRIQPYKPVEMQAMKGAEQGRSSTDSVVTITAANTHSVSTPVAGESDADGSRDSRIGIAVSAEPIEERGRTQPSTPRRAPISAGQAGGDLDGFMFNVPASPPVYKSQRGMTVNTGQAVSEAPSAKPEDTGSERRESTDASDYYSVYSASISDM